MAQEHDCPTCRYHPRYGENDRVGVLCLHPCGELYQPEFDTVHLIAPCSGWIEK